MKSSNLLICSICALLLTPIISVHAHSNSLSIEHAWYQLKTQDDDVAAGQAAQQRAAALLSSSNSLLLPQIDLVGSYTRLDSPVELDALALNPLNSIADSRVGSQLINLAGGPDIFRTPATSRNVTRSSLVMFWPLYTGGKITTARELLGLSENEAGLLLEEIYRQRFNTLVATYFGLVMAEHALNTQEQAEAMLASHYRSAKALEEQSQIARVERLASEASYDRSRIVTRSVREQRDLAKQTLASLIHQSTQSDYSEDLELQPSTALFTLENLPPIEIFKTGIKDHPAMRLLANKKSQAESIEKASRGLYRPNVFMFGSYNLYEDNSLASDLTPDWFVGLGVNLPLVDRSGRSGKIEAARSTVIEIQHRQRSVERQLVLLLDHQYREARHALEEYRDLASTLALAEESLRLQELAFSEGLGRSLDVIDAQTFLSSTHTKRDAAAFKFVLSLAQLLSLSGQQETFFSYINRGVPVQ